LKFQAVAEKTAKNFRGLLFLPDPVDAIRAIDTGLSKTASCCHHATMYVQFSYIGA